MSLHQTLKKSYGNTTGYGHLGYFCAMLLVLCVQGTTILADIANLFSLASWNDFRYGLLPLFRAVPALLVAGVWIGRSLGSWKFLWTVFFGATVLTIITPVSTWLVVFPVCGWVVAGLFMPKTLKEWLLNDNMNVKMVDSVGFISMIFLAVGAGLFCFYESYKVPDTALSAQYSKKYRLLGVESEKSYEHDPRERIDAWVLQFPEGNIQVTRNEKSFITLRNLNSGEMQQWTSPDLALSFRTCEKGAMTHDVDVIPGYSIGIYAASTYTKTMGEDCGTASRVMLTLALEKGAALVAKVDETQVKGSLKRY